MMCPGARRGCTAQHARLPARPRLPPPIAGRLRSSLPSTAATHTADTTHALTCRMGSTMSFHPNRASTSCTCHSLRALGRQHQPCSAATPTFSCGGVGGGREGGAEMNMESRPRGRVRRIGCRHTGRQQCGVGPAPAPPLAHRAGKPRPQIGAGTARDDVDDVAWVRAQRAQRAAGAVVGRAR